MEEGSGEDGAGRGSLAWHQPALPNRPRPHAGWLVPRWLRKQSGQGGQWARRAKGQGRAGRTKEHEGHGRGEVNSERGGSLDAGSAGEAPTPQSELGTVSRNVHPPLPIALAYCLWPMRIVYCLLPIVYCLSSIVHRGLRVVTCGPCVVKCEVCGCKV
jgi:hypothetical protein